MLAVEVCTNKLPGSVSACSIVLLLPHIHVHGGYALAHGPYLVLWAALLQHAGWGCTEGFLDISLHAALCCCSPIVASTSCRGRCCCTSIYSLVETVAMSWRMVHIWFHCAIVMVLLCTIYMPRH